MTELAERCLKISCERTKEDKDIIKRYSGYKLKEELGLDDNQINLIIAELYDLGFTSKMDMDDMFQISPDGSAYAQRHL